MACLAVQNRYMVWGVLVTLFAKMSRLRALLFSGPSFATLVSAPFPSSFQVPSIRTTIRFIAHLPGPQLPTGPVEARSRSRSAGRGRDASYLAPPARIRTCSFPAYGSYLGSRRQMLAVCVPAPVTRLPGPE